MTKAFRATHLGLGLLFCCLLTANTAQRLTPVDSQHHFDDLETFVPHSNAKRSIQTIDIPVYTKPCHVDAVQLIREFSAKLMACPSVRAPGYTIVGVQGQKTLFADSVGISDLENDVAATPDTLWSIGSVTKSLTAVLVGRMVDEGKLNWNTPIVDILPDYRPMDAQRRFVTVRDLLSMQMGVSRNDQVWAAGQAGNTTRLLQNFRFLEPSANIRSQFYYNNFGYVFAGRVVEHVSGESWSQQLANLFAHLNMSESVTTQAQAIASGRYAYPHLRNAVTGLAGNVQPRDLNVLTVDQVAAAGSAALTAEDIAKYLKAFLSNDFGGYLTVETHSFLTNGGVMSLYNFDGSQNTVINFIDNPVDAVALSLSRYGNSWLQGLYKGRQLYMANGGTLGHSTWAMFFPSDQLAFLFSSNMGSMAGVGQFMWNIGVYARDAMMNQLDDTTNTTNICDRASAVAGFVDNSWQVGFTDTFTFAEIRFWVGNYQHPFYGNLVIRALPGNRLECEYGNYKGLFLRNPQGQLGWYTSPDYYQVNLFVPQAESIGPIAHTIRFGFNNPDPVFRRGSISIASNESA